MSPAALPAGPDLALAALGALPEALLVFAADGRLALLNPAARALLRLPPDGPDPLGLPAAALARLCAAPEAAAPGSPAPRSLAEEAALLAAFTRGEGAVALPGLAGEALPLPEGGHLLRLRPLPDPTDPQAPAPETPLAAPGMTLAQREALQQAVLHAQETGLAYYDASGFLRLFNPAYARIVQVPPGSLRLGLHYDDILRLMLRLIPPGSEDAAVIAQRRQADRSRPFDLIRRREDGRVMRTVSQPLPGGGFLLSITEVTALHAAQAEASHRAALLDGVLAALPFGVCVWDAGQRLALVNAAYQRILEGEELRVGVHMLDSCRERLARGEYEPGVTLEQVYARQFEFGVQRQRIRRNGTVISSSGAPLPDGGMVTVVADVTALHRAEAAARDRAGVLQAMMDGMRQGVCLFDSEHRLVAANALAARMTGLRPEELVPGTPLESLRRLQFERGEFGAGSDAELIFVSRAVGPVQRQDRYTRTRVDGTVIEIVTDPTPDGGYVRTYADVTEERRTRQAIERARFAAEAADAAKSRFLATMSHELRTPLNAVIGFAEALAAEPETPDAQEFAQTILQAGRQLLSLIDVILEVAKLEVAKTGAEDFRLETRALFLPSALEAVVRLARPEAEAAQLQLEAPPAPPDLPRALAEERRLRQILQSLLSNAMKFTPPGGRIRLAAQALPDGRVEISVADTGIGIPPEQLPLVFEPFVQLETTHARSYGGSGLGLYLARTLAQAMGAELMLESPTPQGQGTLARLVLAPAPPPGPPQHQEQTA